MEKDIQLIWRSFVLLHNSECASSCEPDGSIGTLYLPCLPMKTSQFVSFLPVGSVESTLNVLTFSDDVNL